MNKKREDNRCSECGCYMKLEENINECGDFEFICNNLKCLVKNIGKK